LGAVSREWVGFGRLPWLPQADCDGDVLGGPGWGAVVTSWGGFGTSLGGSVEVMAQGLGVGFGGGGWVLGR